MHLKSGSLLQGGKYRIENVLGKGGFGITYLAVQTGLNRKVAVKEFFMKEHCNRDESSYVSVPSVGSKILVEKFRQKFIKEAQMIAEMDNQHIVRVYDIFEENGTAYYVMEYLHGGDLNRRIPSSGLPESQALYYIRQISSALSYIHKRNVLHLDVKPSNVLFRDEDNLVLIDFGISKHYDESGCQTSSTPAGVSKGYAPLEQYNQGIGSFMEATDVYSLAATLYKLLTGSTPPEATIVNEDGLPELPSMISPSIAAAVKSGMQPRRKDRPQTIDEFLKIVDDKDDVVDKDKYKASCEDTEIVQMNPSFPVGWGWFFKSFFPMFYWDEYSRLVRGVIVVAILVFIILLLAPNVDLFLLWVLLFFVFCVLGIFVYPFAIKGLFERGVMSKKQYRLVVAGSILSGGLAFGLTSVLSNTTCIVYRLFITMGFVREFKGNGMKLWVRIFVLVPSLLGCFTFLILFLLLFGTDS